MTPSKKALTDEEFTELLALPGTGSGSAASEDEDLKAMRSLLQDYRTETMHWAERRSAGMPSLAKAARQSDRWAALPQWSLALVAVISIAGGIVHLSGTRVDTEDAPVATGSLRPAVEETSQADIAADNRLLSSIDEALSYHAASPVDSLHLQRAK